MPPENDGDNGANSANNPASGNQSAKPTGNEGGGNAGNSGNQNPASSNPSTKPTGGGSTSKPVLHIPKSQMNKIKQDLYDEVKADVLKDLQAVQGDAPTRLAKIEPEYEAAKKRIRELESQLAERDDRDLAAIDAEIKSWPPEWADGDPRKTNPDAPVSLVQQWATWARPLVQKHITQDPAPGNTGGDPPAKQGGGNANDANNGGGNQGDAAKREADMQAVIDAQLKQAGLDPATVGGGFYYTPQPLPSGK
jgi:hypothetical protein